MSELRLNLDTGKFEALEPETNKVLAVGRLEVDLVQGVAPVIHNSVKFITESGEEPPAPPVATEVEA
jgi:hypothetical protein